MPLPPGPISAFVLVLGGETIVAPSDPAIEPIEAPGIWVLDDTSSPASVRFYPDLPHDFPPCACHGAASACQGPVLVGADTGPICDCLDPGELIPDNDDDNDDNNDDNDNDDNCEDADDYPVSLVGGTLYLHGESHTTCGGMNIYDIFSGSEPLVAAPVDLTRPALRLEGCEEDDSTASASAPWPLPRTFCGTAEMATDPDCERCREFTAEASVYTLHRGRLYRMDNEMDSSGSGVRRWFSRALTPKTCPTPADPCGPVARFPGLASADDFWVASDGRHALRLDGGQLSLLGGAAPLPRGSLASATVLGVRWHADARPLIAAMRARAPRPRPLTACSRDADCTVHAGCDLRCEARECVVNSEREPVALATEDRGFVDSHGGSDWGLRCLQPLRARRFGAAQAACEAGLAVASKPTTRGALLYNLGLIARNTGDEATARARFVDSLAARPGNAVVTRALADLGPE